MIKPKELVEIIQNLTKNIRNGKGQTLVQRFSSGKTKYRIGSKSFEEKINHLSYRIFPKKITKNVVALLYFYL